nr:PREDICTED: interferon-induced 35 kDa protein [Latimeria chalumnae]|eukprot:XP_014350028.1 PREDICTED: interferon-induced 35 kDa protein [Latimeria chalumnae]
MSMEHSAEMPDPAKQLEIIQREIKAHKLSCGQIENDIAKLQHAKNETECITSKFTTRISEFEKSIEDQKHASEKRNKLLQRKLEEQQREHRKLCEMKEHITEEMAEVDKVMSKLGEQHKVSACVPEKKMHFAGTFLKEDSGSSFDVKPRVLYPVNGGTALVTFEDAEVAQNILALKDHEIELGECRIKVAASPVTLPTPAYIEVRLNLVLPTPNSATYKLNNIEYGNSGILTLLCKEINHLAGILLLQIAVSISEKTVQLQGIPDVMDEDSLQDNLEIHFQKPSNGGGEVDTFLYIPQGKSAIAVFEEDVQTPDQK